MVFVQNHYFTERRDMLQYYVNHRPSPEGTAAMQKQKELQDQFLNQARRDRTPVTVFLMNGFQLRGTIRGFDAFVVPP